MKVIAFDPFLSPERAHGDRRREGRARRPAARADFITLHTPLTDKTRTSCRRRGARQDQEGRAHHQLRPRRPGRRGGAARSARSGHVAARRFDVFVDRAGDENPLFGHPNVVCTPHLGASTTEAQENVALQVAEQMSDYLLTGAITEKRERSIAGTCFSDGKPRFIQIKGINIDAEVGEHMLYTTNEDVPGIIGLLGMTMGKNGVNIANFTLGRSGVGQDAIALLYLDQQIDPKVVQTLESTGMFSQVKPLHFVGA
jgi:hypothetical protein